MATERHKTKYPGVFFRWARRPGGKGQERVFYVTWKTDGKSREARVGAEFRDNMTPARAAKIRGQYIEGERLTPAERRRQERSNLSINQIWELYRVDLKPHTHETFQSELRRLPTALLAKRPLEITTSEVEAADRGMIKEGYSPQSRRHSLSLLARLIKWGVEHQHCDPAPNLRIIPPSVDNRKTEFLTDTQLARLEEALAEDHDQLSALAVRIAMLTGIRRGAIFGLKWPDLDLESGFLTLRGDSAKNGKTQRIPLSQAAKSVFQEVWELSQELGVHEYIFPAKNGGQRKQFSKLFVQRIRERAELPPDFRLLHGLRHTFASRLASSGQIDIYTLQKLLTHESPEMTTRYAHLMDEALKRAASVVDDVFAKEKEKNISGVDKRTLEG